jgi:HEAT repeat protein
MLLAWAGMLPLLTVPSFAAAQQAAATAPTDHKSVADLFSADDRVRLAAVRALVENGVAKRDAVQAFVEASKDPAWFVRAEAARGLGKAGKDAVPELCELLGDENREVRAAAAHVLAGLGADARAALPNLAEALRDTDSDVRDAAVGALDKMGKEAAPVALGALKDKDGKVRELGLSLLEDMPTEARRALPAVLDALSDVEVGVRRGAARCLGQMTDDADAAVPALAKLFRKDQAVWVRRDACAALRRFGAKAVPVLIDALADPRRDVRRLAASCLGDLGYDAWDALPYLYLSKNDPERWVRSAADSAVEQIQTNNYGNGRR